MGCSLAGRETMIRDRKCPSTRLSLPRVPWHSAPTRLARVAQGGYLVAATAASQEISHLSSKDQFG